MIKKILKFVFPLDYLTPKFITTVGGALAVSGAASAVGGMAAAGEAGRAAGAATEAEERMFQQGRADLAPFREAGLSAIGRYQDLLKDPSKITETPGYQFRLQEGLEGIGAVKGMQGKLFSGETGKKLTEYGQQYATSELDRALSREYNLANIGASAAAGQATQAGYAGQTLADIQMQRGQQTASAYGQIGGGLGDVLGAKGYASFLEN